MAATVEIKRVGVKGEAFPLCRDVSGPDALQHALIVRRSRGGWDWSRDFEN